MPEAILNGHTVLFDEIDAPLFFSRKWWISTKKGEPTYLLSTNKDGVRPKFVRFHRLIMNAPEGMFVDHINMNKLDNRRANLRICTDTQNKSNCSGRSASSKYKGVSVHRGKWQANISYNCQDYYLGCFADEKDAARAYNEKAKELFGEYAYLNQIEETALDAALEIIKQARG